MTTIRESLEEMERVCTRRAFFLRIGKAAGGLGAAAAYDRFGPALFGQAARPTLATVLPIFRAFGKLVIPVGAGFQDLVVLTKRRDGGFDRKNVLPVLFVPMTGEAQRRDLP